ncbi:unnamed protein product [Acanthoscelides obtectus]|uniref:Uncharacterized protein n=1 Tax=Acanthoscelides obtectus TaxID=200917 RepID=A0A9P0P5Q8_ACAOB|nr:unnamed protein product [Acanthoscelides obtectus]CAK1656023.1 hypothetical protein AOBTE_LOCUS19522 [Acanthoscelides obtectus]
MTFGETQRTETLGLYWACQEDCLMFNINTEFSKKVTKRTILSEIAQIFDPLGLLGPCVILAKIMMQRLWLCKNQWDESLPADLDTSWKRFREQLQQVNYVKITRHVLCDNPVRVEIYGFADASLEAYGACVYVRSEDANGKVYVRVMCSKTKVAPLKTITVPRLELCAALLVANLVQKVKTSLTVKIDEIVLWSDSSVCLTWIHTPPNILQTFVGNRVSQIQGLTQINQWNHISTKDNPADLPSRGLSPELIEPCELWW